MVSSAKKWPTYLGKMCTFVGFDSCFRFTPGALAAELLRACPFFSADVPTNVPTELHSASEARSPLSSLWLGLCDCAACASAACSALLCFAGCQFSSTLFADHHHANLDNSHHHSQRRSRQPRRQEHSAASSGLWMEMGADGIPNVTTFGSGVGTTTFSYSSSYSSSGGPTQVYSTSTSTRIGSGGVSLGPSLLWALSNNSYVCWTHVAVGPCYMLYSFISY